MRILMISPQPFFESRGAPFCVYQHIKALLALGYEVDLVTYHIGQNVDHPGLKIYRAPSVPFIRGVKPGPSLAKFPLDLFVFLTAIWKLCSRRYTYIHTHEEAGFMGVILAALFRCKHLYYMHSDLSQVVSSSEFTKSRFVMRCVDFVQKFMVSRADAVIVFYPEIELTVKRIAPRKPVYLILPPAVDEGLPPADPDEVAKLRNQLKLNDGQVLLYTGTLESYQGIDLLLQSVPKVLSEFPNVHYIIVGGRPDQIEKLQSLAEALGITEAVQFLGQRPLEEMPAFVALADMLLSPRSKGTHTPLKLYSYLRSGKPILATDILAHTQILTSDVSLLVPATAEALAQGALELLRDQKLAQSLGMQARKVAEEQYSWKAFLEKNRQVYTEFMGTVNSDLEQEEPTRDSVSSRSA